MVVWVTHRKEHVLLVLVDSARVRNRVSVLDHRHRLSCGKEKRQDARYERGRNRGRDVTPGVVVMMVGWHSGQMCVEKTLQLTEQARQLPNAALLLTLNPHDVWWCVCTVCVCVCVCVISCARSALGWWGKAGRFWQTVWPWMGKRGEESRKTAETLKYPLEFATN